MKAIMISVRPQWVAKILNGEKTIEIRKKFPKDYVGWVYIYVTHGRQLLDLRKEDTKDNYRLTFDKSNNVRWSYIPLLNGKVVARFWCDKVEELYPSWLIWHYKEGNFCNMSIPFDYRKKDFWEELAKKSCLSIGELFNYLNLEKNEGYAIHITKLEIFDKAKEIGEFNAYCKGGAKCLHCKHHWTDDSSGCSIDKCSGKPLTSAPQSYCFIEIGE